MSKTEKKKAFNKPIWEQLMLAALIGLPVYFAVLLYTESILSHNEETTAFFLTCYFMVGVYMGRALMRFLIVRNKTIPTTLIKQLAIVIVVCIVWLFIAGEITARHSKWGLRLLMVGLPFIVLAVATGMFIKLVRQSTREQLTEARASAEQSQSELKLLQSQLSPHFLFNTLNNMYGLSLTQHEKIPGLLLKLSSLLRYSVYDARELFVPLKNEVAYIYDYLEFEKIRIGDRLVLETSFEEPINPHLTIAPLLLIVFIENAFKHGKNSTDEKIYIHITLKTWGNSILFAVKNSVNSNNNTTSVLHANSGFGLANVTKRLELLYKDKYDLQIENQDGFYQVLLNLKVK
jgi:Putative regulator of cell autolysis